VRDLGLRPSDQLEPGQVGLVRMERSRISPSSCGRLCGVTATARRRSVAGWKRRSSAKHGTTSTWACGKSRRVIVASIGPTAMNGGRRSGANRSIAGTACDALGVWPWLKITVRWSSRAAWARDLAASPGTTSTSSGATGAPTRTGALWSNQAGTTFCAPT